MKYLLILLPVFALSSQWSLAGNASDITVTNLRFHNDWNTPTGYVSVGVDKVPSEINTHSSNPSICFKFKATTEEGKLMFSILLAAKSSGQKIKVWFDENKNGGNDLLSLSSLQIVELQ